MNAVNRSLLLKNLAAIVIIVALVACGLKPTTEPANTPLPPTPEITATPTPAPDRIALYDPSGLAGSSVTTLIGDFATAQALGFETLTALPSDLAGIKVLVLFDTPPNLTELAGSFTATQFLVAANPAPTVSANVSVITTRPEDLAFMAGFITTITAEEWRGGALVPEEINNFFQEAFFNGGRYFCGQCTPIYAPSLYYPQIYPYVSGSDAVAVSVVATALVNDTSAKSVYLDPSGDLPEVLDSLPNTALLGSNPNSTNLDRYAAILGVDAASAIADLLPDLLAGNGGQTVGARVALLVVNNHELIGSGKQALFDQTALDLSEGRIDPLNVP